MKTERHERNAQTHARTRDGLIHDRQLVAVMAQFGSGAPFAASLHLVHDESQCRSVYLQEFVTFIQLQVITVNMDIIRCRSSMIVCTPKGTVTSPYFYRNPLLHSLQTVKRLKSQPVSSGAWHPMRELLQYHNYHLIQYHLLLQNIHKTVTS